MLFRLEMNIMKNVIEAENFSDYVNQSLYENVNFIQDVESEILGVLPGGTAHVEVDYEAIVTDYTKEPSQVELVVTWFAKYEASDLTNDGTAKVLVDFTPRGKKPAVMKLNRFIEFRDTMAD